MDKLPKTILMVGVGVFFYSLNLSAVSQTLRQAIVHTLHTNPDVLASTNVRNASNEEVKQARAGYFPSVDIRAAYGRQHTRRAFVTPGTVVRTTNLWRSEAGVFARQMLFDGFFTSNEVKRTKAKTNADAYQVQATSEDIALLTTMAYLNVLRNRELVSIAKQNLTTHQRTYSKVKRRSEQGLGRIADISQASGRLELAKANYIAARSNLRDAMTTYYKIVGMKPASLQLPRSPKSIVLPRSERSAIEMALDNHPTLKSAKANVVEAQAQQQSAKANFYPRIDLVLGANKSRNIDGVPGPYDDYFALVELNYNIFRGGADKARVRQTAFQAQEAADIKNSTARQVIESMKLSWTSLTMASRRLPHLRAHQNASYETVYAYRKQFELGKRTLLDLLDSENELFTSRSSYVSGRYELLLAKYRVLNSMGKLIEYLKVSIPAEGAVPYQGSPSYQNSSYLTTSAPASYYNQNAGSAAESNTTRSSFGRRGPESHDPLPSPSYLPT